MSKDIFSIVIDVQKRAEELNTHGDDWEHFLTLFNSIQKLKEAQTSSDKTRKQNLPKKENLNKLLKWLEENGAWNNKKKKKNESGETIFDNSSTITLQTDLPEGSGLISVRDLAKGECILQIPKNLLISGQIGMNNEEMKALFFVNPILSQLPNIPLVVQLLSEKWKTPVSFWAPYINILPTEFNNCLYFTSDDLLSLQSSSSFSQAVKMIKNVARQYCLLYQILYHSPHKSKWNNLIPMARFTWDQFVWASSVVLSRQNKIPTQEHPEGESFLIPLWDMANHKGGEITTFYEPSKESLVCYSLQDFTSGQQVYIYYGPRTNGQLLLNSGFVMTDNRDDSLTFKPTVVQNNLTKENGNGIFLTPEKLRFLQENSLLINSDYSISQGEDLNKNRFLQLLRILSSDQAPTVVDKLNFVLSVPFEDELVALTRFSEQMNLLLKSYPTTLEDDQKKLETLSKGSNIYYITLLLISEKQLIQRTLTSIHCLTEKKKKNQRKKAKKASKQQQQQQQQQTNPILFSVQDIIKVLNTATERKTMQVYTATGRRRREG